MSGLHILFHTNRFNLTETRPDYINADCYGDDLAVWLKSKLQKNKDRQVTITPEDWGWRVDVGTAPDGHVLRINGLLDEIPHLPNDGEGRLIVEKKRTLWQRLLGNDGTVRDDPMVVELLALLHGEADIMDVKLEDD